MSAKGGANIVKILVIATAILNLVLNFYFIISTYIGKREGEYYRYLWQWNVYYAASVTASVLVLYGVAKAKNFLLIISCILSGLILCVLLYAVAVAKFSYSNCERELCRISGGGCDICYNQNYGDYHLTTKWTCKMIFNCLLPIFTNLKNAF